MGNVRKWSSFVDCRAGLDLENGEVRDNKEAGIFEPAMSKVR